MYLNGQVVHDLNTNQPVRVGGEEDSAFAYSEIPLRTAHYITSNPKYSEYLHAKYDPVNSPTVIINGKRYHPIDQNVPQEYVIYLPASISDAREKLSKGIICPAPVSTTHHWRCRNWLSNHNAGSCSCFKKE